MLCFDAIVSYNRENCMQMMPKGFERIKTGTLETIRIKTNQCMTVPIHKQVRDLSFQVAPKYCKTTAKEHLQVSLLVNIIT